MKKTILSVEHLLSAVVLAFKKDMKMSVEKMAVNELGQLTVTMAVDEIRCSNLDTAAARKALEKCGIKMKYLHEAYGGETLKMVFPYEVTTVSGVMFVHLTERQLSNMVCSVTKAVFGGVPVVTMKPLNFIARQVGCTIDVHYISDGMPADTSDFLSELEAVAVMFNGFSAPPIFTPNNVTADMVFALDSEDVSDEEEDEYV